jgi:hypothetical protein
MYKIDQAPPNSIAMFTPNAPARSDRVPSHYSIRTWGGCLPAIEIEQTTEPVATKEATGAGHVLLRSVGQNISQADGYVRGGSSVPCIRRLPGGDVPGDSRSRRHFAFTESYSI